MKGRKVLEGLTLSSLVKENYKNRRKMDSAGMPRATEAGIGLCSCTSFDEDSMGYFGVRKGRKRLMAPVRATRRPL